MHKFMSHFLWLHDIYPLIICTIVKRLLIEVADVKSTKAIVIVSKHKQPLKLAKWMKKTHSDSC